MYVCMHVCIRHLQTYVFIRHCICYLNMFNTDVRCRKTLDDSDVVDVTLYECMRTQYIESADDNRDDMMT